MENKYRYRHIARFVIETATPLAVGSGEKDLLTDSVVARDVNGLPYIPGTAIAGIIRHALVETHHATSEIDRFFGFSGNKKDSGHGSEIIFSSAQIVDEDGKAVEGLRQLKSGYLKNFVELPIRQHVRINDKGTAENHGKFDEEVVYKGTRFCFEIELFSSQKEDENFKKVLGELAKNTIRFGGGTRKGFGEINIERLNCESYDLTDSNDLERYINKTSSLNDQIWNHANLENPNKIKVTEENWTEYKLELTPDDFFLFGSGFGDDEADMTPVMEKYIDWEDKQNPKYPWKEDTILIPGSSVKGAVAHRVAYHYNKSKGVFAENLTTIKEIPELLKKGYTIPEKFDSNKDLSKMVIEYNPAVRALFGYTSQNEKKQQRGNVLISDVIQAKKNEKPKILNHVSIDRFTGGAIDGALFSESVVYGNEETYTITFKVKSSVLMKDGDIEKSFENALYDIVCGLLPLGGGTNRGHGCFNGKLYKNEKEIIK